MESKFSEFSESRQSDEGQLKDPCCYICLTGSVIICPSFTQEVTGSNNIFVTKMLSLNLLNSVKTFRQNSTDLT